MFTNISPKQRLLLTQRLWARLLTYAVMSRRFEYAVWLIFFSVREHNAMIYDLHSMAKCLELSVFSGFFIKAAVPLATLLCALRRSPMCGVSALRSLVNSWFFEEKSIVVRLNDRIVIVHRYKFIKASLFKPIALGSKIIKVQIDYNYIWR